MKIVDRFLSYWQKLPLCRRKIIIGIVALLLVLNWLRTWRPLGSIPPTGEPKIVYLSCRRGAIWGEIYSMNLDGTDKRLLLTYPLNRVVIQVDTHVEKPVIRPDRREIAFFLRRSYRQSIWTMNINGDGLKRLTPWVQIASTPQYTADGRNIVFGYSTDRADHPEVGIYQMNTNGHWWREVEKYTAFRTNRAEQKRIALKVARILDPQGPWVTLDKKSLHDETNGLHGEASVIEHANGKTFSIPQLTKRDSTFSLSPDRKQFAFDTAQFGQEAIFVVNADGTGLKRLTAGFPPDRKPKFTPDGKQIVFMRGEYRSESGNTDIFIMNADGTNQRALTNTPVNETEFDVR